MTKKHFIKAGIFIGFALLLKFRFDYTSAQILFIIGFGLVARVLNHLLTGFISPSRWLYKLRFGLMGSWLGLLIGLLIYINNNWGAEIQIGYKDLILLLGIAPAFGVLFWGILFYSNHRKLKKSTPTEYDPYQILTTRATYKSNSGGKESGRLILTPERLLFQSEDSNETLLDVHNNEVQSTIIRNQYQIPTGIEIKDAGSIDVLFPLFWQKTLACGDLET